jgi:hypothetical protein
MPDDQYQFPQRRVHLAPDFAPVLLVVIDTEEEYDWSGAVDRNNTSVTAMANVDAAQRIFDEYQIRPIYVIDYPIASQRAGFGPLADITQSGRCQIGAHLHPWVNPPCVEAVNNVNSYIGNLPKALVSEKMRVLRQTIEDNLGVRPVIFKAGRYGIARHVLELLVEHGYEVDCSTTPGFDYRRDGGPNFADSCLDCFWCGPDDKILGIPTTGALVGFWQWQASVTYHFCSSGWRPRLRLPGILSRINALDRLRLSPEGFTPEEHRKLTRFLLDRGVRIFTFSFHSPSLVPGHTSYVTNSADLTRFLDSFRRYFDYFFAELQGRTMTALELKDVLRTHSRSQKESQ